MLTKSKSKKLLITSVAALGTLSLVLVANAINERGGVFVLANEVNGIDRTVSVKQGNRYIHTRIGEEEVYSPVAFKMQGSSYGLIYTSQSQKDVQDNDNNAALVLWDISEKCNFRINSSQYTDQSVTLIEKDNLQVQVYKFDHLTQIDIILDNSDDKRLTTLLTKIGKLSEPEISIDDKTYTYTWTPDNEEGYITSNQEVYFEPFDNDTERTRTGKALWVRELVFHYSC